MHYKERPIAEEPECHRGTEYQIDILTFDIVRTLISITHNSGLYTIDYFPRPLSANPPQWSSTLKQFVNFCRRIV